MKNRKNGSFPLVVALALCASSVTTASAATPSEKSAGNARSGMPDASARARVQASAQPDVEKRRLEAETEAKRTLDQDAIAAVDETEKAIAAIASGNTDEALTAIERATGKINVLTARDPATALLPVRLDVEAIDLAPVDPAEIKKLSDAAESAVGKGDFPQVRTILQHLISEIRVRTFNLPLASYPSALKEAARLLDQKRNDEAAAVLVTAVNTLVMIDHVTPLPVVFAEAAVIAAQGVSATDKDAAQKILPIAKQELDRAKLLGYAANDPEYLALNNAISDLEKQLKGNSDTASAFTKLKDKISSFLHRQSDSEKRAQVASR
jgi:hypothetical protein